MKKLLAFMMIAGMFSFVACGPAEEKKAEEGTATEATTGTPADAGQTAATDSATATPVQADSTVQAPK